MRIAILGFFGLEWDIFVFITSTKQFIANGVTPYDTALSNPPYIYLNTPPFIQNWYAYPPLPLLVFSFFYLIYLALPLNGPFWERFFIKLPIAISDLLVAKISGDIIFEIKNDEKSANYIRKAILYNPLFIFIGPFWGMFDSIVILFYLVALKLLIKERYAESAFFYALSLLMKQITVIFLPLILITVKNRKTIREMVKYLIVVLLTTFLICLPFLLDNFWGFINQVILMHLERPPWGYNIFMFLWLIIVVLPIDLKSIIIFGISLDYLYQAILSVISSALLITVLLHIILKHYSKNHEGIAGIINLFHSSALMMMAFLVFNKVSNDQYYLYLVSLLLISSLLIDFEGYRKLANKISKFLTIAGLIAGFRVLLFIPPDILRTFLHLEHEQLFLLLSPMGGRISIIGIMTTLIAIILAGVFYVDMIKTLLPHLKVSPYIRVILRRISAARIGKFPSIVIKVIIKRMTLKKIFAIILILHIIISVSKVKGIHAEGNNLEEFELRSKSVGIYYLWWINPSHNATIKDGLWINATWTPVEGYYDLSYPYISQDVLEFQNAGIDFVVLDYFFGDKYAIDLFDQISREKKMPYIISFNLYRLRYKSDVSLLLAPMAPNNTYILGYYALKENTKFLIADELVQLTSFFSSPYYLKVNNLPVIIIRGISRVLPDWSIDGQVYLAYSLLDYLQVTYNVSEDNVYNFLSKRWNASIDSVTDILLFYPENYTSFIKSNDIIIEDWINAFNYALRVFWQGILNIVKEEAGGAYVILDWGRYYPPSNDSIYFSLDFNSSIFIPSEDKMSNINVSRLQVLTNKLSKERGGLSFVSVYPAFLVNPLEKSVVDNLLSNYASSWNLALSLNPDVIIIYSWNDYIHGAVIEPTKEYGRSLIESTKYYISLYKNN